MTPRVHPLTVLYAYAVVGMATVGNCFFWVRGEPRVSAAAAGAYTGFAVVYLLIFAFGAGPLLYNAHYYADNEARLKSVHRAVALLWIVADTPLFACDVAIQQAAGLVSVIQCQTFLLRLASWGAGLVFVWTVGLRVGAAYLHARTTCDEDLRRYWQCRKAA
eukprot:TRINITY_DN7520_c0_g1_i16.p1 TRINITY_DN7520_c0_g1~~TRINITY_DN7520_c0_g1_i16.p1  ORF type:complete len:162 (+),score=42.53 TRINITY_DN7520_c0_g1_i16:449-934(+)